MMMKDGEFESNKDDRDHHNASSSATDHTLSVTKDQCESVSAMHHQQQLRKNHQIDALHCHGRETRNRRCDFPSLHDWWF